MISDGYASTFSELFIAVSDFIRSVDPESGSGSGYGFRIRVRDLDSGSGFGFGIRIRIGVPDPAIDGSNALL
jgi:hypothetical protein